MRSGWLVLALFPVLLGSQNTVQKPAPGSKVRKAVLDGLRPSIEKDLKQKVIFKVETIRVYKGWAFVHVYPIQPNGPVDGRMKLKKPKMVREIPVPRWIKDILGTRLPK